MAQFQGSFVPDSLRTEPTVNLESPSIKYFTLDNRENLQEISDTLFDDFEKYNPARTFDDASYTLGNLGSSAYNIEYKTRDHMYTDPGFHQYDIYKLKQEDFRFYEQNRAYNDLFFSPVAGQRNFLVKAKFARNFADNVNFVVDYTRYNQEGFYQNQKTKSTAFGLGIWKHYPEKKHHLFISFLANNHNEEHNGGVSTDTLFDQELYRLRLAIPVRLNEDTTRHQNFTYAIDNYFDGLSKKYKVHHKIQFEKGYFRYGDHGADTTDDQLVYRSYLTDTRGLRYFLGFSALRNDFDLSFTTSSVKISTGISHKYQRFNNSKEVFDINDIVVFGDFSFKIKDFSDFIGRAELGLGSNAGNLKLNGLISISAIKNLKLNAFINITRYDPSLLNEKVYVTDILLYVNEFSRTNEVQLGGQLQWTKMNANLEFYSGIIENALAYDQDALPYQIDSNLEYIRIKFSHKLKWKFLGLENSLLFQNFSENIYRLPKLFSIHNVYFESHLFKKRLFARIGILYYNIQGDGDLSFMPVIGIFYPSSTSIDNYAYSEFYANFKINQFRLFFKIDNFTELIERKVHYQIENHPQFDYKMRIGVRWLIFD